MILLGEMRDLETISTALTAAETGHLVFATLHTQDAASTVDRVIDVFPAAQQGQIRTQLAGTLQGVVAQALLPTADGQGRVSAIEILFPDDAVRNLIRQAKVEQIYSIMQTGGQKGMQTMEQSLAELVLRGVVTEEVALPGLAKPSSSWGFSAAAPSRAAPSPAAYGWQEPSRGPEEGDQAVRPLRPEEARTRRLRKRPRMAPSRRSRALRGSRRSREAKPRASRSSTRRPSEMQNASLGRRGKKLVGLKIGASQLAAARVVNNGGAPSSSRSPRQTSSPASSSAVSCATPTRSPRRSRRSSRSTSCHARAFGSASPATESASVRSRLPASTTRSSCKRDPLPRPRGAPDPARGSGCSTITS